MKKAYQAPATKIVALQHQAHLLVGTNDPVLKTNRKDQGDPTQNGLGIDIISTSEFDPGGFNRSREWFADE